MRPKSREALVGFGVAPQLAQGLDGQDLALGCEHPVRKERRVLLEQGERAARIGAQLSSR